MGVHASAIKVRLHIRLLSEIRFHRPQAESHPAGSMPLVMAIACIGMGMTPAEALVAGTLGAAWALE